MTNLERVGLSERLRLQEEALKRLVKAARAHMQFLTERDCGCLCADSDCAECVEYYEAGEAAMKELVSALEQAEQAAPE